MKRSLMSGVSAVPVLVASDKSAGNNQYGKAMPTEYGEYDGGYKLSFVEEDFLSDVHFASYDGYPSKGYAG